MVFDFGCKYKLGDLDDVDDYFKKLDEANAERLFYEAMMKRGEFDTMKDSLDEYLQNQQDQPDTRADLKAFVEKIENYPKTREEIAE